MRCGAGAGPRSTPRGSGTTGGGWGVLRAGGAFVQCAQPLASRSRPSWSRGGSEKARARADVGTRISRPRVSAMLRASGVRTWGGRRAVAQEPRGPVSTALTLTGKASSSPRGNGGILRFLIGLQRLSGPNVSAMDTDGPPGGLHRPTAEVQADRGLRFATGTSLTSTGRRSRLSRLEDNAVLGGQVRRRPGVDGPTGCFERRRRRPGKSR